MSARWIGQDFIGSGLLCDLHAIVAHKEDYRPIGQTVDLQIEDGLLQVFLEPLQPLSSAMCTLNKGTGGAQENLEESLLDLQVIL